MPYCSTRWVPGNSRQVRRHAGLRGVKRPSLAEFGEEAVQIELLLLGQAQDQAGGINDCPLILRFT